MKLAFLTDHPVGGYTICLPVSTTSHTRNLRDWFPPSPEGAERGEKAVKRWNAKIRKELKNSTHGLPAETPAAR